MRSFLFESGALTRPALKIGADDNVVIADD